MNFAAMNTHVAIMTKNGGHNKVTYVANYSWEFE